MLKKILIGVAIVILLVLGLLLERRLTMPEPSNLGVQSGRLTPCPDSPNCVSSFATDEEHRVEPLALDGDPTTALAALRQAIETMPRTAIVDAGEDYLHAEATSLIFRYVDDLEVLIDASAGKIHLRSASRAGYSDLGVNRKRVEALAAAYQAL